jgi:hypothetical protein
MFAEANPNIDIYINNLYLSLENLFSSTNYLPKEFIEGVKGLSELERNKLIYAGTDANYSQIQSTIKLLKEYDGPNYKSKIKQILKKYEKNIDSHLLDDIKKFIQLQ